MSQTTVKLSGNPSDLAGLLAPVGAASFLERSWGKEFRHVAGWPGKFAGLLPWNALNRILEQHRLEPPRLRLTREGQAVAPASYVSVQTNRKKNSIPRLLAAELQRHLRDGATLVLDAVDELHSPITELAESLESIFRVRVQVNAYAGWRTSHGFDLHWDDHDVLILQIAGRKQWKVWGMTRKYPLARDIEPAAPPEGEPLWDGMLSDGDLLYIPRGWWHVAMPLDEPTLHLTVGVNNPTGADLLSWFADRLRADEGVRCDLPMFATDEARHEAAQRMMEAIATAWTPQIISQYLDEADARVRPRARFSLPWSATEDVLPPDNVDFALRWTGARRVRIEKDETAGEISIASHGQKWRFAAKAEPVLRILISQRPSAVSELERACAAAVDRATLRAFLRELVDAGLIAIQSGRDA